MLSSAGLDVISISETSRGTVRAGQEIADRVKNARLGWRVALAPLLLATVVLEERGVTWGAARALFVEARRR
jgi:hypothetical protein